MKKVSIIAVLTLIVMLICSCGGGNNTDTNTGSYADSLEVINTVWNAYAEESKFPAGGGSSDNLNMEGAGKFDHTNKEELDVTLAFPADYADKIDDAASLMHMMNANTFTAGIYRLTDSADASGLSDAFKAGLASRRWMCGFPEKYVVINTGSYVITAFGNGELIDNFKATATDALDGATVLAEGNIEA